jgi:hypothetical protein
LEVVTRSTYAAAFFLAALCFSQQGSDPWPKSDLLDPAALASTLRTPGGKLPKIICVAFPVLYRNKHISHAVFAGPGGRPEGIEMLKKEVATLDKNSEIVLYCGCCPMDKCPNLRPAYRAVKELGFTKVRALNIQENMHTDWYTKDYPAELGSAATK